VAQETLNTSSVSQATKGPVVSKKSAKKLKYILVVVAVVTLVLLVLYYVLSSAGVISPVRFGSGEPVVELRTEYKNPFLSENQYVNPFDEFKSPFNSLK